eukprot:6186559-Pleurochrysis_carterae.AAC.2
MPSTHSTQSNAEWTRNAHANYLVDDNCSTTPAESVQHSGLALLMVASAASGSNELDLATSLWGMQFQCNQALTEKVSFPPRPRVPS